jgi:hypothetical protein
LSSAIHDRNPVRQVIETGKTLHVERIDDDWIARAAAPDRDFMRRMHFASMIVVPLQSYVFGLTGTLTLVATDPKRGFRRDAIPFAEGLARMCASAIGKARLYEESNATAVSFQQAALPSVLPHREGIELFGYYQPATKGLLLGGDWYDAFPLPDGRIGISMGDVTGHGLSACVLMASVKNALRASMIMDPDIVRTLDAVDYMLRVDQHEPGLFCTALLGIVDPEAMTLRLAPAGHPGPKIWDFDKNAVVDPFSDRELPLGLRDMSTRRTQPKTIRLEGGLVVFFTDGLLESTRDYVAGEQALERVISRRQVRDAADPARSIVNAMQCANADDDVAILVLRPATIPRRPLL